MTTNTRRSKHLEDRARGMELAMEADGLVLEISRRSFRLALF